MIERLSLNDPAVRAAKEEFDRPKQGLRPRGTFEEYFKLFSSDSNTFTHIGNLTGVTKESVRQIYKKYFSSLFPNRPDGQSRKKLYTIKRRELELKHFPLPARVREIADMLTEYPCEAIPLSCQYATNKGLRKKALFINEKLCCIRSTRFACRTHPSSKRFYTPVQITIRYLKRYDFLILVQDAKNYPKRYFVIPIPKILNISSRRRLKTLYIPLTKLPPYHNNYPQIDFWRYENAWHLLKD